MSKQYLPPGQTSFHLDYPANGTIGDILTGSAHRYPDRVALRDGDITLTFAELNDAARRVAHGLRDNGIAAGETVALHQPNSVWFTVTYFGILLAGAVVTPTNPALPVVALKDQLEEAGAVAAFSHPSTVATLQAAAPSGLRLTVLVGATAAAPGVAPDDLLEGDDVVALEHLLAFEPTDPVAVRPSDLAHLSFTGGTTGVSKAVRLLHRNVVANSFQGACWRAGARPVVDADGGLGLEVIPGAATPFTAGIGRDAVIAIAPLYHALGMAGQVGGVLAGSEVTILGRFDPAALLRIIEERGITSVPGSPALFHALLAVPGVENADLRSVRSIVTGAAPIDVATQERLADLFPNAIITEGYGLTEATTALTLHPLVSRTEVPAGSVGAPLFDTEISIRDLATGQEVPTGETGEVWARGPQISDGYSGHPELTAEQFVDGWLRTGDLGRVDDEGWLYLVGRAKDMLIYKGYNVYPTPLESHLASHPAVAQASVIGAPSEEVGEIPVAYVVLRAGHEPSDELAEDLMAFVAARVAPYARVREIVFIDALPVSAAGKILKTDLRDQYANAQA